MKKLLLHVICLFFSLPIYCQHPEITSEHFSYNEGLDENSINAIVQDKMGFIWAGGARLHKFDGYTFITVARMPGSKEHPDDWSTPINRLFVDEIGILWLVYNYGIVLFDPEKQRSVLLKDFLGKKDTANNNWAAGLRIIKGSRGTIWIWSKSDLFKLTLKKIIKNRLQRR